MKKGYMLCGALAEVEPYSQEIAFYDAVRAILTKRSPGKNPTERQILLKKLVNQAVYSEGVIDLFDLLEKPQPQISLLSEEFLQTIKKQPNEELMGQRGGALFGKRNQSEIRCKSHLAKRLRATFERSPKSIPQPQFKRGGIWMSSSK